MMSNYDDKSDVIGIVAHDLKTPVVATRGFLDLVQNVGPLNEQQAQFLQRAFGSLDRMEQLITSLLDWARLAAGEPLDMAVLDLRALILDSLNLMESLAAPRDITIHHDMGDAPVKIPGDEHLLRHVIANLVSNAIKYNLDGGSVWVKLEQKPPNVIVTVRDSGIGISEEDQKRIFERFYRAVKKSPDGRRIEGSGIGLSITQAVVALHGGELSLESELDKGSTFTFTLPMHASNKSSAAPRFRQWGGPAGGETIDDVDDNLQERPENPERESKREDR
jgi:signal transduction histidine kinase